LFPDVRDALSHVIATTLGAIRGTDELVSDAIKRMTEAPSRVSRDPVGVIVAQALTHGSAGCGAAVAVSRFMRQCAVKGGVFQWV
jgi:hypothetical protein